MRAKKETKFIFNIRLPLAFITLLFLTCQLSHFVMIGVNMTNSLSQHLFFIIKHVPVKKGGYVAFYPFNNVFYNPNRIFVKQVKGVENDEVKKINRDYYVNGVWQGIVLMKSKTGIALHPGPVGIIPQGKYYVGTSHPRSLDSRYAEVGWIEKRNIVGRAFKLW